MLWPSRSDYTEAIRDFPHISILDPKLKGGNPRRGTNNDLISYCGGFSIVFPIEMLSNTYALRCWIVDIKDAETRYRAISDYLKQCGLPYFVDFEYVPNGILVNGDKYPVTRMEWAEGETLCDFIKQNLQDSRCLKTAAVEFQKMVKTLHTHQISHGDLQDGNILLKRNGTDVEIKLIDYDSVFVPALRGQPDNIVGIPAYQHPQRIAGGGRANEKVDYFSELVIYLSLLSLVEKPDLWSQFGAPTEKRLLFIAEDFNNPDQSDVFRELENLSPDVKHLATKLKELCKLSIDQLEPLEVELPRTSPAQVAYNQGLACLHSKRYNEAVVEFEKAIGLDPNYKEAHHGLGLAHFQMSNFGEAKKAAEAALRIDPHYQPALQLLDAIKSSVTPPVLIPPSLSKRPSGATGSKPVSHTSPPKTLSKPTPTKPASQVEKLQRAFLNRWQWLTGALGFVLVIWIVVFATQMNAKNEAIRQNQELQNQLAERGTELTSLENKNQALRSKNTTLRKQLDRPKQPGAKQVTLEKEKSRLQDDNKNLRQQIETRPTAADLDSLEKKNARLQNKIKNLQAQLRNPGSAYPGKHQQTLAGHTKGVFSVAFSPDELTVASGSWDRTIRLWDAVTGAHRRTLTAHTGGVYSVAFSPDGQLLVSGSDDKTVRLWDAVTGAHRRTLTGHTDWVYCVAFSPDGRTLASGSDDHTTRLWDALAGIHRHTLIGHTASVRSVAFSPDGDTLASGSFDKTIRLWNGATGKHQRTLAGHTDWVYSVAFSPDGRTIASGSWDRTIRLWDPVTGAHQRTLTGHTAGVYSIAFSPDGRTIASGGMDHTVRLWDVVTGTQLQTLTGHTDGVYSVGFRPDSRMLASGSLDKTIRLID